MTTNNKNGETDMQTMTIAEYEDHMCGLDTTGICLTCGCQQEGCEPDARFYACDVCGEKQVFGLEEALICGYLELL